MTDFESAALAALEALQIRSEEILSVLGHIEAYLLAFVVALLCWGVYKLFKLFF